jgi:glycosyltransferase involved in cell wall biosynthesis
MGLSVFVPAYNEEGNVERRVDAFRRVLPQVTDDYEIIIVNDGSMDKTREIAERLVKENPKVRVVQHEKNQGYGVAVRSGIKMAPRGTSFLLVEKVSSMSLSYLI